MRAPPRGLIRDKVCTVGFLSHCWHHRLDGREIEKALRVGDGQGSLACCSAWGRKELNATERLN